MRDREIQPRAPIRQQLLLKLFQVRKAHAYSHTGPTEIFVEQKFASANLRSCCQLILSSGRHPGQDTHHPQEAPTSTFRCICFFGGVYVGHAKKESHRKVQAAPLPLFRSAQSTSKGQEDRHPRTAASGVAGAVVCVQDLRHPR